MNQSPSCDVTVSMMSSPPFSAVGGDRRSSAEGCSQSGSLSGIRTRLIADDRPHTISSGYERVHSRPALTFQTFEPHMAHSETSSTCTAANHSSNLHRTEGAAPRSLPKPRPHSLARSSVLFTDKEEMYFPSATQSAIVARSGKIDSPGSGGANVPRVTQHQFTRMRPPGDQIQTVYGVY